MALAYSNLTGSSASNALNKKLTTTSPSLATLNLSGVGTPPKTGVTNTNVVPAYLQNTAKPAATKTTTTAKTPTATTTTKPAATTSGGSAGTYKGVAITAGSDADIAAQIARIDAGQTGGGTTTPSALPPLTSVASGSSKSNKTTPAPVDNTPNYSGLVGNLADIGKNSSKTFDKANEALVKFRTGAANYKAGIYSAPSSARVMQGRDAAVQLANAQTDAALSTGVANSLTEQGQQITAFDSAAGYAAPVQVAPGNTLSSPITGETVAGGLGGYANYKTAEQVNSLISQYPDAQYIYDQTKTPQENLQAFQSVALQRSPTYQKQTYGVPGAQTVAGATVTQTAQQGYTTSYQQYQNMNTQLQNADGQADLLLQAVKSSGINASDARFANKTVNEIRRQLSSSDLQVFDSALKETQAAYGQLLVGGGGTTPTGAEDAYNVILNPNSSLSAFEAAITQLRRAGQTKVAAQGQQVNQYLTQLNAGSPQPGSGGGSPGGNVFAEQW